MLHVIPWPEYLAQKAAKLNVQASAEPDPPKRRSRTKADAEATEGE